MKNRFTFEANLHTFIKGEEAFLVLAGTNLTNKALGDAEDAGDDVGLELTEFGFQVGKQNSRVDVYKILEREHL